MLVPRDTDVLRSVAHYYTLTRGQINRLHFPDDHDGRLTRRRLQLLHEIGLINRTSMQVVNPSMGAPAYVYYPSANGVAFVKQEFGTEDQGKYDNVNTRTPNWMFLYHWVELAQAHITLDHAVMKIPDVSVEKWIYEHTLLNPDAKEPEDKYQLFTRLGPKLVCAPDAAFLLQKTVPPPAANPLLPMRSFRKVYYVELDRDTTVNSERVAAKKCHGYASLLERRVHKEKHFPSANIDEFAVLFIAPTPKRRDALAKAFSTRPAAKLYKFCSQCELNPDTFLTGAIWHETTENVVPLLKAGGA